MSSKFQTIINSRLGVGFTLTISRMLPPSAGYPFARFLADRIASRRNLAVVKTTRINQWVVNGEKLAVEELDQAVVDTLRHTAHCLYDTYHYHRDEQAMRRMFRLEPEAREQLERIKRERTGTIIVGPHLSNFDFIGQAAAKTEIKALALAVPRPGRGYEWQNRMRRVSGLEIVPTSLETMKKARDVLSDGGIVMTAVDRPIESSKHRLNFFGRPASLPLHHVMLALKTGVSIYVVAVIMNSDGKYEVLHSDPIEMERCQDRKLELTSNAEKVLSVIEDYIRLAPNQWSMYYPVWPEAAKDMP